MSLKVCCFASGSKGNCCFISDGSTDILIDLGISALRAETCLKAIGANPDRVHILLTHSHTDHIGGIKTFIKKHPRASVHCQRETASAVMLCTGVVPTVDGRTFCIGGVDITALPVPHDVPCVGYIVANGDKRVAVVTDVGAVGAGTLQSLSACDLVMLESNHDVELLRKNVKYTQALKNRIASEHGHLSNADCAEACGFLAGQGVRNFILAHLSEENNAPELAVAAVSDRLKFCGITDARIVAAAQNKMTGLFEIC